MERGVMYQPPPYPVTYWDYNSYNVYERPSSIGTTLPSSDSCDQKALLKIKDQKVNLSVSLVEIGKTANMVTDMAKDLKGILRSIGRGSIRGALRTLRKGSLSKDMASRWLQYQYGVIPTMMEVNGLLELIHQKLWEGQYLISGKVSTTEMRTWTSSLNSVTKTGRTTVIRKNTFSYFVDSSTLRTLSQSGISNPAALVWETIPYSFVIDWFLNVGDYLSSLDALVGVKELRVIRSWRVRDICDVSNPPRVGNGQIIQPTKSRVFFAESRRLGSVDVIFPFRPRYEPALGVSRMVSSLALVRNLWK